MKMKTFTVICIEKNETIPGRAAKYLELGHFKSVDGSELKNKARFNRNIWRIWCIAEVR